MCGGGGGSPDPYVAPTDNSAEVEEAMRKERDLARKRKGRKSTILTDLSLDDTQGKTMLGS